mmetsp:Transcript_62411/g.131914  ORF Transcript_62411/g.131914 Transcript_62411/m.131914 type:complete len:259 (-) Transcript_62411:3557-4333(-)
MAARNLHVQEGGNAAPLVHELGDLIIALERLGLEFPDHLVSDRLVVTWAQPSLRGSEHRNSGLQACVRLQVVSCQQGAVPLRGLVNMLQRSQHGWAQYLLSSGIAVVGLDDLLQGLHVLRAVWHGLGQKAQGVGEVGRGEGFADVDGGLSTHVPGVQEGHESNLQTLGLCDLGHLEGDRGSEGVSSEAVRSSGLRLLDLCEEDSCEAVDGGRPLLARHGALRPRKTVGRHRQDLGQRTEASGLHAGSGDEVDRSAAGA